jgi:hypothetical protein
MLLKCVLLEIFNYFSAIFFLKNVCRVQNKYKGKQWTKSMWEISGYLKFPSVFRVRDCLLFSSSDKYCHSFLVALQGKSHQKLCTCNSVEFILKQWLSQLLYLFTFISHCKCKTKQTSRPVIQKMLWGQEALAKVELAASKLCATLKWSLPI